MSCSGRGRRQRRSLAAELSVSWTGARVRNGVAVALRGAVCVVALAACHGAPPQQAEGFRPQLLGKLSFGMPEAGIVSLMGPPLSRVGVGQGPEGREMLTYAAYGAWIKGDVSIGSKGYDCFLWLQGGQLDEVWFLDRTTHRKCQCKKGACPPEWAVPCQTSGKP